MNRDALQELASLRGGVVISPRVFSVAEFARLRDRELRLARDIAEEGIEL